MRSKTLLFVLMLGIFAFATQLTSAQNYYHMTQNEGAIDPGTNDIGLYCDDCTSTSMALPFPYTFYNQTYNNIVVGSNGNIQFTGNTNSLNSGPLPMFEFTSTIFAYQADLYEGDPGNGQGIFTSVSGVAPNRVFNIEWRAKFCCSFGPPTENFEVRLYEGTQTFDVVYGPISTTGESTTVGVQRDNLEYTQYDNRTPGTIFNGMAETFSSFGVTASTADVSGTVLDPSGRGLRNAWVTMSGSRGVIGESLTTDLGGFRFKGVPTGEAYILTVKSQRFDYSPRFFSLVDDLSGITISPSPSSIKPIKGPVPATLKKSIPTLSKLR